MNRAFDLIIKLLLRRTLVLKNNYELLASSYEPLYLARSSQLMARSLLNLTPNVQECDARMPHSNSIARLKRIRTFLSDQCYISFIA